MLEREQSLMEVINHVGHTKDQISKAHSVHDLKDLLSTTM